MEKSMISTDMIINYSEFAKGMFEFLLNSIFKDKPYSKYVQLRLHVFDVENSNLGTCEYPNIINIYIGDIIELFPSNDFTYRFDVTDSYVKSVITEIIMHELLHSNKVPNMNKYKIDKSYHDMEEDIIKKQTIALMINNKVLIENSFGFNLRIELFMDITPGPYNNTGYSIDSLEVYYKTILQNVMPSQIRSRLEAIFASYRNIVLVTNFNGNTSKIKLKHRGKGVPSSLYEFQNIINLYSESGFKTRGAVSGDSKTVSIIVNITEHNCNPMVFGK